MHSINLERWLADQTLVDDCPYAPQVGLGVVVLGHDDLWGLKEEKVELRSKAGDTYATTMLDTHTQ